MKNNLTYVEHTLEYKQVKSKFVNMNVYLTLMPLQLL